ncbi:MAG: FmdB family transcriptional regulator [Actinomycetota bacterium]|nr:FmdB family transcriptional regulator [Actinomycetota bacterium]
MPTYQYACTACAQRLEVVQRFSDDPLTDCPACAGRLRKVFSAVGVVFKGSGFYRTDSRAAAAASNGKGEAKGEGKGEGKGESAGAKPAKDAGSTGEGAAAAGTKTAANGGAGSASKSEKASTSGGKATGSAA